MRTCRAVLYLCPKPSDNSVTTTPRDRQEKLEQLSPEQRSPSCCCAGGAELQNPLPLEQNLQNFNTK